MNYNIVASPAFVRELKRLSKKHISVPKDIKALGDSLKTNPFQGTALGKGCYKIRMAISSKGKVKAVVPGL